MKSSTVKFPDQNAFATLFGWTDEGGFESAITFPSLDVLNDSGDDLLEGDVVVVTSDGSVAKTMTVADGRPTGVCLDDIDDGDSGPVQFLGPVDLVNVTAAVTAGNWGRTSATPGSAEEFGTTGFVYFTTSGTSPEGFLWPAGGGGGGGGGGGSSEAVFDHGNMGATETVDVDDGTWHRGTLDTNCAITVQGFTVDLGTVLIFEVTDVGGNTITWDADVEFVGDDQPDADAVTVFLLFSSAGDSTVYGVKVGGGLTSETLETAGHYEVLMNGASPPEPMEDGSGTDWLYVWVP